MQRVGFIVSAGFQVMSVGAPLHLRILDWETGEPIYHVRLLSKTGGSTRSSIGAGVATEPFDNTNFDTLDCLRELRDPMVDTGLIKILRQALERSRPVASTMRRRVRAGRSWSAPWPSRDHALVPRKRLAGSVPKSEGWRKISNSHHRRPGVDLGRDDRPRAGDDRTGTWARMWPGRG